MCRRRGTLTRGIAGPLSLRAPARGSPVAQSAERCLSSLRDAIWQPARRPSRDGSTRAILPDYALACICHRGQWGGGAGPGTGGQRHAHRPGTQQLRDHGGGRAAFG